MIRSYSDHAANERTFLAWVRTGVAVIAFGFVIEKFNLFIITVASATSLGAARGVGVAKSYRARWAAMTGFRSFSSASKLILVGAIRFLRTGKLLDDPELHSAAGIRGELMILSLLAVIVGALGTYLALGWTRGCACLYLCLCCADIKLSLIIRDIDMHSRLSTDMPSSMSGKASGLSPAQVVSGVALEKDAGRPASPGQATERSSGCSRRCRPA